VKTKYLLSLDGGGVRAVASVIFLSHLERNLSVNLSEKFDFFIGTSAGAIIAMGLAIRGMDSEDLIDLWSESNLNKIMETSNWDNALGLMQMSSKYDGIGKKQLLENYFGGLSLGDAKKPVAVTSYDIEARNPVLLTSYDHPEISVVDAGNASSAAPIYYPTAKVGERYLIDGGIVANHPVLHGYVEAKKLYPNHQIKVLSIGTGLNKRPLKGKASQKWGLIGWIMHDLFGLMLESSLDHELAAELIGKEYLRVNSPIGPVNRRLDDKSSSNLKKIKEMGESWWRDFGDSTLRLLN
tara:strand:- start:83 stop:970 length:888 start_codon:yes stop_codon:yes gene_type:complete